MRKKKRLYSGLILFISLFFLTCSDSDKKDDGGSAKDNPDARTIVVLYTNDEHGWMEASEDGGGAAGMAGLWKNREGYVPDSNFLLLSGGDMWTGPAISTWYKGESMVEVMNSMGYMAAAIGNHEFDFKVPELEKRISESEFDYLGANIRDKNTGSIPEFTKPYTVKNVNGINVGIIGLASTSTPYTTFPDNVKDYDFLSYEDAILEYVPLARLDGAELCVILGHITGTEMTGLVSAAKELDIPLICGGHSHEEISRSYNGINMIQSGSNMMNYVKVEIVFDTLADTLISLVSSIEQNEGGNPDPRLESIVSKWKAELSDELSLVIGYTRDGIERNSYPMYNMITDSWLISFPNAHVSLTNTGGIRQSIPRGNITLETLVGVLPFENNIYELELTGQELLNSTGSLVYGGIKNNNGMKFMDGSEIYPDSVYKVLTTDYLYSRTDLPFQNYDPEPYNTSVHYRQPTIDWIKSLNTSESDPIENYLDYTPR